MMPLQAEVQWFSGNLPPYRQKDISRKWLKGYADFQADTGCTAKTLKRITNSTEKVLIALILRMLIDLLQRPNGFKHYRSPSCQ